MVLHKRLMAQGFFNFHLHTDPLGTSLKFGLCLACLPLCIFNKLPVILMRFEQQNQGQVQREPVLAKRSSNNLYIHTFIRIIYI